MKGMEKGCRMEGSCEYGSRASCGNGGCIETCPVNL